MTTIAYNVYKCEGWHAKLAAKRLGNVGFQVPERIALELATYDPDIVTFSEAPPERTVAHIAERLGMRHVYFPTGGDWPGALLTRFDVVEHRNCPVVEGSRPEDLFTRHWGRAVLDTKGAFGKIVVHSAHLHPTNPPVQVREVSEILKSIAADVRAGRPLLVQGDLNHTPKMPSYSRWVEAGLIDTQAAAGNGDRATIPASKPRLRIDYVWAAGPIAARLKDCRPLFEGQFRTNPDDHGSFALSDHIPVLARFGA
ncbi:MAG: endonuclease/exonuclease/phosphatase family protein [Phycisphaerae bacterium]|nr:endonuclease/exonuclease/phosphatase family protein [Phycisphaerae bacterium]